MSLFSDLVSLASLLVSFMLVVLRYIDFSEKRFERRVEQVIDDYMEQKLVSLFKKAMTDAEIKRELREAIDNSDVSKKLDELITVLCTVDEKLKKTKVCNGTG